MLSASTPLERGPTGQFWALDRRAAVAAADIYGAVTGGAEGELLAHGGVFEQGRAFVHGRVFAQGCVLAQAGVGFSAGWDGSGAEAPGGTCGGCSAGVEADAASGSGALGAEDSPVPLAWPWPHSAAALALALGGL
jgi:hypothetical protein